MAKRRRKKPNIPQAALDNVRQENGIEETSNSSESKSSSSNTASTTKSTSSTPRPRRRGRDLHAAQLNKRKGDSALDPAYVAEQLANPTKTVTEDQLREDYGFVIQDLRNMGILAGVLFVALIGIALVIL